MSYIYQNDDMDALRVTFCSMLEEIETRQDASATPTTPTWNSTMRPTSLKLSWTAFGRCTTKTCSMRPRITWS